MGNNNSTNKVEYETFNKNIYDYSSYNWIPSYPSHRDTYVDDDNIDTTKFKDICDMRKKIPSIPGDDKFGLQVIKICSTYINILLYKSQILSKFHPSVFFTYYNMVSQFNIKQLNSFKMIYNSYKNF